MSERKLASVQMITSIEPIPGADSIEVATVLGWKCVVAKADNFHPGDYVVYIEVDSILPPAPWSAFLAKRGYRVRTIKLRGQVSQGLVLPYNVLQHADGEMPVYLPGRDVTDALGVKKYDPEGERERSELQIARDGKIMKWLMRFKIWRRMLGRYRHRKSGSWPDGIEKTDEVRIQSEPRLLRLIGGKHVFVTEKLDGQSATYFLRRHKRFLLPDRLEFGVCSRNLRRPHGDNSTYWRMKEQHLIEEKMKLRLAETSSSLLVWQGEIVGPGVQGNRYGLPRLELYMFSMVEDGAKLNPAEVRSVAERYALVSVPVLFEYSTLHLGGDATVDDWVICASGEMSTLNHKIPCEGFVARTRDMSVSFKVINPNYLLKYDSREQK